MAKKILQVYREIDLPFFGKKRVNVPLTLGVGLAALGTIPLLINQIAPKYTVDQRASQQTGQTFTEGGQTYIKNPDGTKETVQSKQAVIVQRVNTAPLYSIVKGNTGICNPFRHLVANKTDWDTLMDLIETPIRDSGYYRGSGKYVANLAGEILPRQAPIFNAKSIFNPFADINDLANFINQGGVWIDYTQYSLYYADCQLWVGDIANFNPSRFCELCDLLQISELGWNRQNNKANFFPKKLDTIFPYNRSLTLLNGVPSSNVFKTSNLISSLQNVPFTTGFAEIYSMFALKANNGIYFYSNTGNSPKDYAVFIRAVHDNVI